MNKLILDKDTLAKILKVFQLKKNMRMVRKVFSLKHQEICKK